MLPSGPEVAHAESGWCVCGIACGLAPESEALPGGGAGPEPGPEGFDVGRGAGAAMSRKAKPEVMPIRSSAEVGECSGW